MTDPTSPNRSNFFYDVGLYFPKAAILSLYFELFPSTMPKLRMALYIVTGYTVASGLTTLGINTFYCPHIPDNWSREEDSCSIFNSLLVLQISWVLNFSADISSQYLIHAKVYHASICLHHITSLLTTLSPNPRPRTQATTTKRPDHYLRARHFNHHRQRNSLHQNPDGNGLGPSIYLVHGGNVHRHHGRFHACTEVPPPILEVFVKLALHNSKQLLQ